MSVEVREQIFVSSAPARTPRVPRFPSRPESAGWAATTSDRAETLRRLTVAPLVLATAGGQRRRLAGLELLLDWLEGQPGEDWQQRWLASGAEAGGGHWRAAPAAWLGAHGVHSAAGLQALCAAVPIAVCADVIRPGLGWFVSSVMRGGNFVRMMAGARDAPGFTRVLQECTRDERVSEEVTTHVLYRAAVILGAKGGRLSDIIVGDVLELLDTEAGARASMMAHGSDLYRFLHQLGILGAAAPTTLREARATGQPSPEQMIDHYDLACRPVRDLLVDYLKERQPALDHASLRKLAYHLGMAFWKDLERHHPGIDSLRLSAEVAQEWKTRLRTTGKTVTSADGQGTVAVVERISYRQCLTPVRALYLDLAQWAIEDPARWSRWVAPCPVGAEEIHQRKAALHRKSRMDARTRERLPVLPSLTRAVDENRRLAMVLLDEARKTPLGGSFTAAGQTLTRLAVQRTSSQRVWVYDPVTGRRRDLGVEEDMAFWAWAAVEVLRTTGIRIEELLEISHHNLVQYRLPATGELVPLLQITPSKTDTERLLVISPELADVLSAIICRVRAGSATVPLVRAYDKNERVWLDASPLLFQRRFGTANRGICAVTIRNIINTALAQSGLTERLGERPLHYTPHDFRRIFITDAILSGLPPHIAQVIAGHRDINVTLGYKAVYPEETITAHLAFLARRRALRPSEEYRTPTDSEWQEFLGHFERRKVSTGTCGRAFATPCIHEHACVRCPMLWPDPAQRARLVEIRDNLSARISEAEREGWLGEVEGLQVSFAGATEKLAQIDRRPHTPTTIQLGMPSTRTPSHHEQTD